MKRPEVDRRKLRKWSKPLGSCALALVVLVGSFFLVRALCPADLPRDPGSGFLDTIFHNKGVVLAARLLLVSGAVVLAVAAIYIIWSIVIRIRKGEWLRKAGPFEISEIALKDLESQIETWREEALSGQKEIKELTKQLEESGETIEQLHLAMDDG